MSRIITSVKTRTMPVLLIVALVFSMVIVPPKKAEAIVPVVAGGGAAIAALGVELGISSEAVLAGIIALCAAGTGVYVGANIDMRTADDVMQKPGTDDPYIPSNWDQKYRDYRAPDGRSWDDLTQTEKDSYKTPANYWKQSLIMVALAMGAVKIGENGPEPTPEPDPEEDPEGHKRWQDLRNMLILMGTGAGTIALSDIVNYFGDQVGMRLRSFLYGDPSNDKGLGCLYANTCSVNDVPVNLAIIQKTNNWVVTYHGENVSFGFNELTWFMSTYQLGTNYNNANKNTVYCLQNGAVSNFELSNVTTYNNKDIGYVDPSKITLSGGVEYKENWTEYQKALNTSNHCETIIERSQTGYRNYLNAIYSGSYTFPNGAVYSNGHWTNNTGVLEAVDYGQITGYPQGMANGSTNDEEYKRAGAAFNQTAPNGNQYAARMPSDWSNVSEWSDIVSPIPEEEVTPLPETGLWPGANPNPNPNPTNLEFAEDFGEEVGKLLRQPFDQLFPFCLIGDLERLVNMIKDAGSNGNGTRGISTAAEEEPLNGTQELVIPLSGFGIQGIDDITFDLSIVSQLAHYVRPMMTGLFVCGLLVGSFAFFLKRGGE